MLYACVRTQTSKVLTRVALLYISLFCGFTSGLIQYKCFAEFSEDISYIVLLADWEIAPNTLQVLDRKLGGGQFGIVRQGIYTPETKGDPEVVAVKVLKGT